MKNLVEVKGLSKIFPNADNNNQRLKAMFNILFNSTNNSGTKVLNDISLNVKKGESLAIIGRNGAGKSTLLKIITGVIKASTGTVQVDGSIGALLELGSGFDPEYNGMENLKMASVLAGIDKTQMDDKIAEMIKFADIGEYINQPIKNYSSGMVVRLGFAVVTVTKPDLLITDEVLAVGDESFQRKCIKWIDEYLESGGTLLLVSHSMYHVQKICKDAIWIEKGEIKMQGDAYDVSQAYQSQILFKKANKQQIKVNSRNYHIQQVKFSDDRNYPVKSIETGSTLIIVVQLFSPDNLPPGLSLGIVRSDKQAVYGTFSELNNAVPIKLKDHIYQYTITIPKLPLLPSIYIFRLHTMSPEHIQLIDTVETEIRVMGKTREMGVCKIKTIWS